MVLNLACLSQSSIPSHCGQLCQVLQPKNIMQAVNKKKKKSDTRTQHTYLATMGSFVQVILLFHFILFFKNSPLDLHEEIYYSKMWRRKFSVTVFVSMKAESNRIRKGLCAPLTCLFYTSVSKGHFNTFSQCRTKMYTESPVHSLHRCSLSYLFFSTFIEMQLTYNTVSLRCARYLHAV